MLCACDARAQVSAFSSGETSILSKAFQLFGVLPHMIVMSEPACGCVAMLSPPSQLYWQQKVAADHDDTSSLCGFKEKVLSQNIVIENKTIYSVNKIFS
jgi:hypothetical protein